MPLATAYGAENDMFRLLFLAQPGFGGKYCKSYGGLRPSLSAHTGLHFAPGRAAALVEAVRWWSAHPAEAAFMRTEARLEYETKYTAEENYTQMMNIYDSVLVPAKVS